MSMENLEGSTENLFFKFMGDDKEKQALLFEEINKDLEALLTKENEDKDTTDGVLDLLSSISDSAQEEFEELIGPDGNKKRFLSGLSKIFALLLNTKVDTDEKIKRIIKVAIETIINI